MKTFWRDSFFRTHLSKKLSFRPLALQTMASKAEQKGTKAASIQNSMAKARGAKLELGTRPMLSATTLILALVLVPVVAIIVGLFAVMFGRLWQLSVSDIPFHKFSNHPSELQTLLASGVIRSHEMIPLYRDHPSFVTFAGDVDGPTVVLIHGYPESGLLSYPKQIEFLAKLGYNVVVPDLRGFNGSFDASVPLSEYNPDAAMEDLRILIQKTARGKKVAIVGHDWGCIPVYEVVRLNPHLFATVVQLSGVHLMAYMRYGSKNLYKHVHYSWYILWDFTFGNIGNAAEWVAVSDDYAFMKKFWLGTANTGSYSLQDIEEYKAVWSKPGLMTSMLAWYRYVPNLFLRHLMRDGFEAMAAPEIPASVPVTIVWGCNSLAAKGHT
ncbi:Alpha/Beta hydrolase protein [Chytriomyces sp. MP71]|nr:Alpha/Beta hydrolase protein [Chytriomyces sp. MP71]